MDPLYKCTNGLLGVMVIGNPIKFNFTKTLKKISIDEQVFNKKKSCTLRNLAKM